MPFTPSHAVVALPFVRTPLVPAAIAVGAMTPDLPLFVRGTPLTYAVTHTNVLLTSLVALALLVGWYALIRPGVRELAPRALARRLPQEWDATGLAVLETINPPRRGAKNAVWREPLVFGTLVALSLFIGVVSHIVWDSFTHEGRVGIELLPVLGEQWGPLTGYKWLQHGSSVVGLVIIGVWAVLWLRNRPIAATVPRILPAWVRWAWWLSLPVTLVAAWYIGIAVHGPLGYEVTSQQLAYRMLPSASGLWGMATIALCVVVQVLRRRRAATRRPA